MGFSRLILWDIDGTLVWTGPATRRAFERAVEVVVGRAVDSRSVSFGGKTDPQIALEILATMAVSDGEARDHLPTVIRELERAMEAASEDLEVGAFGSDHADRNQLVAIAVRKLEVRRGVRVSPTDVWVVGDTGRDLDCARAAGARCVLVATGMVPFEELEPLGADATFHDLARTDDVAALLVG